jgi:hypothetical protein
MVMFSRFPENKQSSSAPESSNNTESPIQSEQSDDRAYTESFDDVIATRSHTYMTPQERYEFNKNNQPSLTREKARPTFSSNLRLLSLFVKSHSANFIKQHWIIDKALDDEFYHILDCEVNLLRSQGKSEFAIEIFLFRETANYLWGKFYQSVKYDLSSKKFKKPK